MLPDQPILVSDEKIKVDDWYIDDTLQIRKAIATDKDWVNSGKAAYIICKKIIAGIPGLPSIDYNGLGEQLGIVDIEMQEMLFVLDGQKIYTAHATDNNSATALGGFFRGCKHGFKTAQSLNEKKFSMEDIRNVLNRCEVWWKKEQDTKSWSSVCIEIFKSLSQPKVFDVEVEMEEILIQDYANTPTSPLPPMQKLKCNYPKITENSIKITKVL